MTSLLLLSRLWRVLALVTSWVGRRTVARANALGYTYRGYDAQGRIVLEPRLDVTEYDDLRLGKALGAEGRAEA